jgi:hypothetical protein
MDDRLPPPGAWCRACRGTRWWTERRQQRGWRCHPPAHLKAEAIRLQGQDAPETGLL